MTSEIKSNFSFVSKCFSLKVSGLGKKTTHRSPLEMRKIGHSSLGSILALKTVSFMLSDLQHTIFLISNGALYLV